MGHPSHQFTYGLGAVIDRLGQSHGRAGAERTERWKIAYVTGLIDGQGFPPPLPLMEGAEIRCTVRPGSRWTVAAVERWFAGFMPPDGDPADALAQQQAAEEMDAAAGDLLPRRRAASPGRPVLHVVGGAA